MAGQRARQRLACALIFLLAMGEVSAAREKFATAHAVKIIGNAREESSARHQQQELVTDAGSFSVSTMWASGKQSSLQWLSANVTFRYKEESPPYIEIGGLDTTYRILPDAVVATEKINGMQTMWIVGWQAYRASKGHFGSSHYSKDEALYFRMEMNPVVGETKSGYFRSAGHKIYEHKEGDKILRYFLNSKGTQKTVDEDEVDFHAGKSYDPKMELQVPGQTPKTMTRPDQDLMALVDGMLGEVSCMGKPNTCAFRCFYDSENDVCGPLHFCEKVGSGPADNLAPFGAEQKCKALGATDHEAADLEIAKKMEDIKKEMLDLVEKMEQSPAISEKSSSRSSLKASAAMFQEVTQMLDVMEAFPMRLAPEGGDFTRAAARAAKTDMKHWRGRPDRLTIPQYEKAGQASIADVRDSQDFSVPAKLHSTLVDYVKKRPNMLIQFLKQETHDKCSLSDETDDRRAELETFADYFLSVPGHNLNDLKDISQGIPTACRDFLLNEGETDVQSLIQTAEEGKQLLSNSASATSAGADGFIQVKSSRLARALGSEKISLLESGTSDFADDESERVQDVGFIIFCIVVCIVLFIVTVGLWKLSIHIFQKSCLTEGGLGCFGTFVFFVMGALVICFAFALALPIGITVLVAAILGGVGVVVKEVKDEGSEGTMSSWRAAM
ncbi:unnamed protein product [Symbiodinium sp. CCMP2592]|nr:unnamed protein product [Symbiodinium sp. CCMP2592]